jgi:hypothetical protein
MAEEVTSVAKGYDLDPARARIQKILDESQVGVELNMASQISFFDIRTMRTNFTADIANSVTEADVSEIIQQVLQDVDEFKAYLDSELTRIVGIAENNPNLADRVQEARDAADSIRERVNLMFDDAYGEGELESSAKVSEIMFADLLTSYKISFDNAQDKDEVD